MERRTTRPSRRTSRRKSWGTITSTSCPTSWGERSPINDTNARGMFIGMTMDTTRADMLQAVLEGVAFAIT